MSKYETLNEIGRGGFGIVHKIKNAKGHIYAKKTFNPASYIPKAAYERLRIRFKREVMIQAERLCRNLV